MREGREPRAHVCAFARALHRARATLLLAGTASAALNALALTGSLYALAIYGAVLPAGNLAALIVLTLGMLALYAVSGAFDFARGQLLARAASHVDGELSGRVFAAQQALALAPRRGDGLQPMRDLEQIRAFLASAGPTALFDLPFLPLYLGAIALLHPLFGALAVAGALLLSGLLLCAEQSGAPPAQAAAQSAGRRFAFAMAAHRNAEAVVAMGLLPGLARRYSALNADHLAAQQDVARRSGAVGAAIRAARPALQSGLLGLGAYLVLTGRGSAGAMLAAAIILARAFSPIETAIAHWRAFMAARQAYVRLAALFSAMPEPSVERGNGGRPRESLNVDALSLAPPGASSPALHAIDFHLAAGAGLCVVGSSAAGKSTLARALTGVWPARSGAVCLDGKSLSDWDTHARGRHIGYVPQEAALLAGTIADNIARFDAAAAPEEIAAAARAAGAECFIEALPAGYATDIGEGAAVLSAGQRQRIALARALFRDPFLVVLDEPDTNLDAEGAAHLLAAIDTVRRRGGIVVVMTHRRLLLSRLDQVLVLVRGRVAAFGSRDSVLAEASMPVAAAE